MRLIALQQLINELSNLRVQQKRLREECLDALSFREAGPVGAERWYYTIHDRKTAQQIIDIVKGELEARQSAIVAELKEAGIEVE